MNISFFVGFYGDTRGINIYLCNNFLLFFGFVISFSSLTFSLLWKIIFFLDNWCFFASFFCSWYELIQFCFSDKSSTCLAKTIYHFYKNKFKTKNHNSCVSYYVWFEHNPNQSCYFDIFQLFPSWHANTSAILSPHVNNTSDTILLRMFWYSRKLLTCVTFYK
jgi:hypothetical protein